MPAVPGVPVLPACPPPVQVLVGADGAPYSVDGHGPPPGFGAFRADGRDGGGSPDRGDPAAAAAADSSGGDYYDDTDADDADDEADLYSDASVPDIRAGDEFGLD